MFFCLHIFFTFSICINTPLQLKACKVNTFYIEEYVLKGCFMIETFRIEFKLIPISIIACLIVSINIVDLFIYIFNQNTLLVYTYL